MEPTQQATGRRGETHTSGCLRRAPDPRPERGAALDEHPAGVTTRRPSPSLRTTSKNSWKQVKGRDLRVSGPQFHSATPRVPGVATGTWARQVGHDPTYRCLKVILTALASSPHGAMFVID